MTYIFHIFINIYISIKYNHIYLNMVTMTTLDELVILEINHEHRFFKKMVTKYYLGNSNNY